MAFKTILRGRMLEMRNRLLPCFRELISYLVPMIPLYGTLVIVCACSRIIKTLKKSLCNILEIFMSQATKKKERPFPPFFY